MILHNFVVFEGIDGAGTTTQLKLLQSKLSSKTASFTAEPTEKAVGTFIRQILKGDVQVHQETLARLFAADRQEHLSGIGGIQEEIAAGKIVFCDRYLFSSLAYQNKDSGGEKLVQLVEHENSDFPLPEIVFYFKIRPEISLRRITGRGVIEIFEKQEILEKVADRYEAVFSAYRKNEPEMRIIELNAEQATEDIANIIWRTISTLPIFTM